MTPSTSPRCTVQAAPRPGGTVTLRKTLSDTAGFPPLRSDLLPSFLEVGSPTASLLPGDCYTDCVASEVGRQRFWLGRAGSGEIGAAPLGRPTGLIWLGFQPTRSASTEPGSVPAPRSLIDGERCSARPGCGGRVAHSRRRSRSR